MDSCEVLKSYDRGNYKYCLQQLEQKSLSSDSIELWKEIINLSTLDKVAIELLLQNNKAVCNAIIVQMEWDEPKWLESMNVFLKLHSHYKSLQVIPEELEVNVVYNMLWWYWIKPQTLCTEYHMKTSFRALSWCLIKVLRVSGEIVLGQHMCSDNASGIVNLFKQSTDRLVLLKPVTSIQLLDIITITIHVLLRERFTEAAAECMPFMIKIVDQIDLLELHVKQHRTVGFEEFCFKFGFKSVNSTASLKNYEDSIYAFVATCSLNCLMNNEYDLAASCFKKMSKEESSYNFMLNYLKALCHLRSRRLSEAKLCLAYVMSGPIPPVQLAHYRLLLARLLGAQGDHQAALAQCDAVLASYPAHSRLASLAAHLAVEQANELGVTTAELNYLRQLVQVLKTGLPGDNGDFNSFEECCLTTLSRQFSISLPEALYTLARRLYLAGYHIKSMESYKELLELVKTQIPESSALLPCRPQLIQEYILTHIKSNRLTGCEHLCRRLVTDHLPHSGAGQDLTEWEVTLYSMEDDVIGLLLLSDVLSAAGNKRKAMEELNRCQNALTEKQGQATSKTEMELCDWLLSRVMLRKAKISDVPDATHYFRRALIHKPGDREVMFYYKQWSLWHPDHDSFDPGDVNAAVTFPTETLHNLAVRYVLGCSVSEEEWNHLFDHNTSQNIIESLFEDDD